MCQIMYEQLTKLSENNGARSVTENKISVCTLNEFVGVQWVSKPSYRAWDKGTQDLQRILLHAKFTFSKIWSNRQYTHTLELKSMKRKVASHD